MAQTAQHRTIENVDNEAKRVFALQREAYSRQPFPTYEEEIRRAADAAPLRMQFQGCRSPLQSDLASSPLPLIGRTSLRNGHHAERWPHSVLSQLS